MPEMSHPRYGTRTIAEQQRQSYENTGWTEGPAATPDVVAGSVEDVLAAVGNDPQKAAEALAAEQSRTKPRTTLVTALERIAETPENQE